MAKAIQLLDNSLLAMLDITALVWQGNPSEEQKLKILLGKLNSQPAVCSSGSFYGVLYYSHIRYQQYKDQQRTGPMVLSISFFFFALFVFRNASQTHAVPCMGQVSNAGSTVHQSSLSCWNYTFDPAVGWTLGWSEKHSTPKFYAWLTYYTLIYTHFPQKCNMFLPISYF